MDKRIEAFLKDVLAFEGEISNLLREGVRRQLATCEKQFRDAESNKRMKDRAAQACRTLCRTRVAEEIRTQGIDRRTSENSAQYHRLALFPLNDN